MASKQLYGARPHARQNVVAVVASMSRYVIVVVLWLLASSRSTTATVVYSINLCNNTRYEIEIVSPNTGAVWARIQPKSSTTFAYYSGLTVRFVGEQLHFDRVDPPKQYIAAGIFSVSFKAQLNPDLRIYLLSSSTRMPSAQIPPQPKGFPLKGKRK